MSRNPSVANPRWLQVATGGCLALMTGAAWFLSHWGEFQKLGEPGVKVVHHDVYFHPTRDADLPLEMRFAGTNAVSLPEVVRGFRSEPLPLHQVVYEVLPKDSTFGQRRYFPEDNASFIDTYVVLMGVDRTSIHQPQYCLVGQGFNIRSEEKVAIPMTQPIPYTLEVKKLLASKQHRMESGQAVELSGVLLYWFVSGENLAAEHHGRMTSIAKSLLTTGVLERWAYITYFSPCYPGDEERTFDRMVRLIQAAVPQFQLVPRAPGEQH